MMEKRTYIKWFGVIGVGLLLSIGCGDSSGSSEEVQDSNLAVSTGDCSSWKKDLQKELEKKFAGEGKTLTQILGPQPPGLEDGRTFIPVTCRVKKVFSVGSAEHEVVANGMTDAMWRTFTSICKNTVGTRGFFKSTREGKEKVRTQACGEQQNSTETSQLGKANVASISNEILARFECKNATYPNRLNLKAGDQGTAAVPKGSYAQYIAEGFDGICNAAR
ncbi:MAG: hypothetical protein AAF320_00615 [Myxococcota bacterium]